jgi:hypothetical protein
MIPLTPTKFGAVGIYSKGYGCNGYSGDAVPSDVIIEVSGIGMVIKYVYHPTKLTVTLKALFVYSFNIQGVS